MKKFLSAVMAGAMVASMAAVAVSAAVTYEAVLNVNALKNENGAALGATPTVASDTKVYIDLNEIDDSTGGAVFSSTSYLTDSDWASFKFKKDEGSKLIKSIAVVEKELHPIMGRKPYVEIKLNEDMTDADTKVEITTTITIKNKTANPLYNDRFNLTALNGNDKVKFTTKFWVKNTKDDSDDQTYAAGTTGVVLKPVKNEDNTIEWENENDTIAKLTYEADSDVVTIYPKLSTKWDNALYGSQFAAADAYVFDFVGNPTISSTSRPLLTIYNPFVNDDDDTASVEDLYVYQLIDGELVDVTKQFKATDDEGDEVLTTKTRTLGTYIISDKPATTAKTEEPTTPDAVEPPVAPTPVKPNPGTGR